MSDTVVPTTTTILGPAPVAPPAPPAPAPVTVEHISALHRHLEELRSWVGERFEEIVALVEKAAPIAAAAAAAVAPVLGAVAAPVVAAVENISELLGCCPHITRQHNPDGTCAACPCKGPAPVTGS